MLIPHPTPPIELARGTLTARSRSPARLPRPFSPSSTTSPRTPPRASARPPASRRGPPPVARVRWLRPRRLLPRLRLLYKDINAGGTVPWCNPGVAVTVTSVTHDCCASFQSHRRAMALSRGMPHRKMRAERRIDRRCIDCRRRSAQWRIPIRVVKPDPPHHLQGPLLRKVGVIGNLVHSSPNIKKEVINAGALQRVIGLLRSDLLGQVMPLAGRDWSQSGVARLFSATKENGYQLMFLSARAIVQAFLTKASSST